MLTENKNDELLNKLSFISPRNVSRRLTNEIKEILKTNKYEADDITIEPCGPTYSPNTYIISFYDSYENKTFKFNICNYPFTMPKFTINSKPYHEYLRIRSIAFGRALNKYTKKMCLCCDSKMCYANWSPKYKFMDVITEFKVNEKLCQKIVRIILLNVIKRKYSLEDINLIDWLY
tara:strand:+ start:174 stop:701 length:528 start_codon:yes stop_codon:yes gene_type:complete